MKTDSPSISGLLLAALGVVLFSTKAIMVKLAYQFEIDHVSLLLLRMVFSLPIYVIIGVFFDRHIRTTPIRKRDYLGVIFAGVVGYYLASLFDFMGLRYITASLERLILFTYPTIVVLISRFVLKEKITRAQYLGVALTYLGMLIIFGDQIVEVRFDNFWLGVGLVFMSAITYAIYLLFSGKYIPRFGTVRFTSIALTVSAISVISHYSVTDHVSILSYPPQIYLIGVTMAVIATVIPSFLISAAIQRIGASNMSIIGSIGPVSTIILAYMFLDEQLTVNQGIGAIVVIAGVVWVNRRKSIRTKAA